MRVMVMVKASEQSEAGVLPTEEQLAKMSAYNEQLSEAGVILAGEGLHPSNRGVRLSYADRQPTVLDGPFAETKELVAGFWLWQVSSLAEAIEWAKRIPFTDGEVEVRPVLEAEDFGDQLTPELREREERLRDQLEAQQS